TFANDNSPLVFFCPYEMNSCSLFVLDTTTMEILSLKLQERMNNSIYQYYFVAGVHEGEITMRRTTRTEVGDKEELTFEICNAKFPEALKNCEKAALARDIREKIKREENERRFAEVDQKMNSMNDEMNQMRLKIDELERKYLIFFLQNTKLKDQVAESNGKYKKLLMM
ncbi:hypothetical protein PFISCL1PPCAC_16972, partial [Pristionchus fissidentatus]